jgi:hypothetical protein
MNAFMSRFRWAVLLAVSQATIFASVGISEHRRHLRYSHRRDSAQIEYFGCFRLPHQRLPSEIRWDLAYEDCFPAASVKFVGLMNLPVFMVWSGFAGLTRTINVDQFWLFYVVNGFGIPAFWFCVGSLFDRRRRRHATAVINPPTDHDELLTNAPVGIWPAGQIGCIRSRCGHLLFLWLQGILDIEL